MRTYRKEILVCVGLCVLIVLVFAQVQKHEFIAFGVVESLSDIAGIRGGLTLDGTAQAFKEGLYRQWQPLAFLSHMAAVEFFGTDPGAHHLLNLFLHLLNSLLLFLILRRTTAGVWPSGFVAALFALHPLHVEPVVWMAGRRDLLFGLAWMLALWAYARYADRPGRLRYAVVLALFILGAMASPVMGTLPIVLLLMDFWPLRRLKAPLQPENRRGSEEKEVGLERAILEKAGYLAAFFLLGLFAIHTVPALERIEFFGSWASPHQVKLALLSYVTYIGKMFWPTEMSLSYPPLESVPLWQAAGAGFLLAAVTVAVIRWGRRRPYLPVGWFWYLATVTPVVGLVPFGPDRIADRYAYIPLTGLFIILAWGIPELVERFKISKKWLAAAAGCVLAACMITSQAQTSHWKNSYVLFSHLTKNETNDPGLYFSYGVAAMQEENFEEAVGAFQEVIRLDPRNTAARNQLGIILAQEGRSEEAQALFEEGIGLDARQSENIYNYGLLLMQQGKNQEAQRQFEATLAVDPQNEGAHNALGVLLTEQKRYDEARHHFSEAIRIAPRRPEAEFNMGLSYMYEGNMPEAKERYRKALAVDPDHAKAHLYLGKLLFRERDLAGAFTHFNEVLRINPNDPEAQHAVGVLYVERGDHEAAKRHLEAALQLNSGNVEARRLLAEMDRDAGRPSDSREKQGRTLPGDPIGPLYEKGLAMVSAGRLEDAKRAFEALLRKDPRHAGAYYNLGVITARQKKLGEAEAHFSKALEITPEDGQIYNNLGAVLAQQGRFDEAIAQFSKALRINPEDGKAKQNLALAQQIKQKKGMGDGR